MIIGAHVKHAAPFHPAGAEWSIHDAFKWLASRGHDCRVLAEKGSTRERGADGVLVYSQPTPEEEATHWRECDVMLTQLDATMAAQILAVTHQTPLVHYIHSASQLVNLGVVSTCSALVIFNSEHVATENHWWPGEALVLHPPVDIQRVKSRAAAGGATPGSGACVTLVNVSHNKGGAAFWRAAVAMPDLPFLGVQGVYGDQVYGPEGLPGTKTAPATISPPTNMRVSPPTPDIARGVFDYTRLLLVLSEQETYGRVAAEAMVSGIPVITTDTPGLREACGNAAVYLRHRDDLTGLQHAITKAYREDWQLLSERSLSQAEHVYARSEMELRHLERALASVHHDKPRMTL